MHRERQRTHTVDERSRWFVRSSSITPATRSMSAKANSPSTVTRLNCLLRVGNEEMHMHLISSFQRCFAKVVFLSLLLILISFRSGAQDIAPPIPERLVLQRSSSKLPCSFRCQMKA